MKKLYAVVSLCSFFLGYSQINLNSPETKSRTVTDPVSITLSQGFRATSSEVVLQGFKILILVIRLLLEGEELLL